MSSTTKTSNSKLIWLIVGVIAFFVVYFIPTPEGLTAQGQVALAAMVMAVILWMTEAVPYTVSTMMLIGFIAVFMGLSPDPELAGEITGTSNALGMALGGFSSTSLWLVAGGLFIAVAMEATGLHKRVAYLILDKIGTSPSRIIIGIIIVAIVLALFVPSATARSGAMVPIVLGIISALGAEKNGKLSKVLIITTITAISIWNYGILTSSAQNPLSLSFIQEAFGVEVTWMQWFIYGAPFAILMSIALFFVMKFVFRLSEDDYNADPNVVKTELEQLGPVTTGEKKLMLYSAILLILWSTGDILHPIDSTTATLFMFMIMLLPGLGIMSWKQVQDGTNWGTLLTFGFGISLGQILLNTGAASWLSENTLGAMGVQNMGPVLMTVVLAAASAIIHLGFASATSLASVYIPIVIGLLGLVEDPTYNLAGIAVIQAFVISFGYILPVNAPQNMLAYGSGAFESGDLVKAGVPMTIIGLILVGILAATYWQWIGLL